MIPSRDPNCCETIPPISTQELAQSALPGSGIDPCSLKLMESEFEWLRQRRATHELPDPSEGNLTGLALSGGGIRSATFSLGVLQALAKYKLLKHFDYLSTVSGGGYIGSSLTWWLSPHSGPKPELERGAFGVGKQDFPYGTENPAIWRGQLGTAPAPKLLHLLRLQCGSLSSHVESHFFPLLGAAFRSTSVAAAIWLPMLIAMLAALHLVASYPFSQAPVPLCWTPSIVPCPPSTVDSFRTAMYVGAVSSVLLLPILVSSRSLLQHYGRSDYRIKYNSYNTSDERTDVYDNVLRFAYRHRMLLWCICFFFVMFLLAWFARSREAAVADVLIMTAVFTILGVWSISCWYSVVSPSVGAERRSDFSDLFRVVFLTVTLAAVVALPPKAAAWIQDAATVPSGLIIGVASSILGVMMWIMEIFERGNRFIVELHKRTSVDVITIASILLAVGILLVLYHVALSVTEGEYVWLIIVLPVAISLALLVDLNAVSFVTFYRDRFLEIFMPDYGAALDGTSVDVDYPGGADEMPLYDAPLNGPYPIINTSVLLAKSKDRRRRLRGTDSFILTPSFCGSNATGWCDTRSFMNGKMTLATAAATSGIPRERINPSRRPRVSAVLSLLNFRLGYWVPHPGPRREPDGSWTRTAAANQGAIPNHFRPGFSSLLFGHREDAPFQELVDGGHFDNLGIYELLRRRVRRMVVCDAGEDPEFRFDDLQIALRRVYEDFGARIEFIPDRAMEDTSAKAIHGADARDLKRARRGFAVANVYYPSDLDPYGQIRPDAWPAILIYIKTTLVDEMPLALWGNRAGHPDFPHQATGGQFFDEGQFEAYRWLGFWVASSMLEELAAHLAELTGGTQQSHDSAAD